MKALIVVDVQNDFLPGGNLPVPQGDEVIPFINEKMPEFELVVATQDWHPADHGSFASQHPGKSPGDVVELNGLEQILWPDHCIQHSFGASFASGLDIEQIEHVVRKGTDPGVDSYSGFFDNGHKVDTGLNDLLKKRGVDTIYIAGLAGDVCVKFTALDGASLGYNTYLYTQGTRAVNLNEGDFEKALEEMENGGVEIIE
ncbi:MAG: bifunctional nicotinamidase/pyrazinamidase, partial [Spirochaetaceae bacterium]